MGMQAEGGYRVPAEKSPLPVDLVCGRALLLPTAPQIWHLKTEHPDNSSFVVGWFSILEVDPRALHSILLLNYVP